jgi:predicted transposase/invertase (TIGR01784 family)
MLTTAQQIEKKGMQQGIQSRNIEMAKSLLRKGLDIKLIQEVTSLSKKLIEELAKK